MSDSTTSEITALTQQLTGDALATWSDEKRKDFTNTFAARVNVARYILVKTASIVAERATNRHFISDKHEKQLPDNFLYPPTELYDSGKDQWGYATHANAVGGRPCSELDEIATERAEAILNNLPLLNVAVRIISPEISKLIEKRDKLLAKGKELLKKTEDLSGPMDMDDLDQGMSIGAFRALVKDRDKKRVALLNQMDEVGAEGQVLSVRVNRFLYEGLPGLSDAVIKVICDLVDRSTAFSAMNRRVLEQVQFGDSEAALDMLKSFEKDEATISSDIKEQFDQALETLKVAAKKALVSKSKKQLTTGKK